MKLPRRQFLQLVAGAATLPAQDAAALPAPAQRICTGSSDSKNTLYCSFCSQSQHEVRKLIAGPAVFICDECLELCMDIIRAGEVA